MIKKYKNPLYSQSPRFVYIMYMYYQKSFKSASLNAHPNFVSIPNFEYMCMCLCVCVCVRACVFGNSMCVGQ